MILTVNQVIKNAKKQARETILATEHVRVEFKTGHSNSSQASTLKGVTTAIRRISKAFPASLLKR